MPRKEDGESVVSETGNWNVADSYSKTKIMRPLFMADYYEDIAIFGFESIAEELIGYANIPNDLVRYKAVKRLLHELIRVIDNSKFALKKPGTKNLVLKYRKMLKDLDEESIPHLVKIRYNQAEGTNRIYIEDEDLFMEVVGKISEIKSKINEPLNKNHLIFTDKEEFDPIEFKKRIKDRMINKG